MTFRCANGPVPGGGHSRAYLQVRLRVRGQERLPRAGQERLARRDERPRGRCARLAEVKNAHWARRLEGGPPGPLSGEHRLLSLLVKRWSGLSER